MLVMLLCFEVVCLDTLNVDGLASTIGTCRAMSFWNTDLEASASAKPEDEPLGPPLLLLLNRPFAYSLRTL